MSKLLSAILTVVCPTVQRQQHRQKMNQCLQMTGHVLVTEPFTLHLPVKYVNVNYNIYIIARLIHAEMTITKLNETSRNVYASKPSNRQSQYNTRKQQIL